VRAEGIPIRGQGPLKADSIVQAVSALRSIHTDRFLSEEVFESPQLKRILKGVRRVQGEQDTAKAAPLSKIQLQRITAPAPELPGTTDEWEDVPDETTLPDKEINNLNFDTAIKLAFAGFMRTAEITYEAKDLENAKVFEHTKLQRRDVTFAENDEHAIVRLRSSKADYEHKGVEIVVAKTGDHTCPVSALRALVTLDPQPPKSPLFRTHSGPFSRAKFITEMRRRLKTKGYTEWKSYSGHSPRRGAAQHAADNGILESDIQHLGRWSSQAYKGYFQLSQAYKFGLNKRFQTGRSIPIITTSLNVPE
jgi:integrase